jgi:hypothetical protein
VRATIVAALLALAAATACGERLERKNVDGIDCVVGQSRVGRVGALSCDWSGG